MSQSAAEFDIVRVVPHVDLVTFGNVISCYPRDRPITVSYTLGEAVTSSGWDWVGIFHCDWENLGQYLVYNWAPSTIRDCTAPRRRALSFPARQHKLPADSRRQFQFLYISQGSHVIGVSSPFKIVSPEVDPEFCLSNLFAEVASVKCKLSRQLKTSRARKARRFPLLVSDSYEVIQTQPNTSTAKSNKRRRRGKSKLSRILDKSEANAPTDGTKMQDGAEASKDGVAPSEDEAAPSEEGAVASKDRVVTYKDGAATPEERGVTKEGSKSRKRCMQVQPRVDVPCKKTILEIYRNPEMPLDLARLCFSRVSNPHLSIPRVVEDFDRHHQDCATTLDTSEQVGSPSAILPIEYPAYLSLKAGPQSYLLSMRNASLDSCSMCQVAQTLVKDLCERLSDHEKKEEALRKRLMKMEKVERVRAEETLQVQSQSQRLDLPTKSQEAEKGPSYTEKLQVNGKTEAVSPKMSNATEEDSSWVLQEQKSTARMKKTVDKKNQEIESLFTQLRNKEAQIQSLQNQVTACRKENHNALAMSNKFEKMAEDLQARIKIVLVDREAGQKNGWKLKTCNSKENGAQTDEQQQSGSTTSTSGNNNRSKYLPRTRVTNKQISKLKSAETIPPRTRLHKERRQAEQCSTCGLKFSLQTDKGVIDNHVQYHLRNAN